jgi:hypothetical protein
MVVISHALPEAARRPSGGPSARSAPRTDDQGSERDSGLREAKRAERAPGA